ncbi:hypothetical protein BD626DRAFT_474747 [Schizophyllum amplum]|uniref:Protein kinase domain-containing protein n=1 Tax=Schizophyllum amplum TaxID=97359 RepID=A0A550CXX2_9AGAR|nr:hypothetical protein BD626DRAFT_474747 [Auriculariopsis ampla]
MDATRISDNKRVVLRKAATWKDELPIYHHFAQLPADNRNRLAPLLDIILLPDTDEDAFLVIPFLRVYYDPPFSRTDQAVQCVSQFLEMLQYFHEHNIAHRDFCSLNLMMDASELLPGGHHFAESYCSPDGHYGLAFRDRIEVSPVKYFVIDLGLASQLPNRQSLVTGVFGQDKTVPELSWDIPYDPFLVDIYQFGRVIVEEFVDMYDGLEFLRPLAEMMVREDPQCRPDITKVCEVFAGIVSKLPPTLLEQPVCVMDWEQHKYRYARPPLPDRGFWQCC